MCVISQASFRHEMSVSFIYFTVQVMCLILPPPEVFAGYVTTVSKTSWPVGSDVTFEWSYTDGTGQTLSEIRFGVNDDQLLSVSSSESVTETNPWPSKWTWYQGRVSWTGSVSNKKAAFKLTKAALNDSRTFYCYVEWSGVYQVKTKYVTILVTVLPTVIQPAVGSHYTKGNRVNITCNTTGTPTPSVHWFRERDSHEYPASTGASYLVFDPIGKDDAGKYKCKATNSAGNNEATVDIVVHYKPETTTMSNNATGSGSVAVTGEYVLLRCEVAVDAAKPAVSQYRFYHFRSSKLLQNSSSGDYVIPSIQYSDRGRYKCVAINSVGDGPEQLVDITVQEPAKITSPSSSVYNVTEGEPVPLVCVATGHPSPIVTWTRDGRIVGVQGNATIVKSTRGDAGDYTCTARNTVREVPKSSTIIITVKIMYKPEIVTGESNSSVGSWDNNDLTLQCVAEGVPTATFQWFKPGGWEITANINPFKGGSRVTVKTSAPGDYGQYKCRANNIVGFTDHIITVNQWHKPGKPKITLKEADIQASYIKLTWTPPVDNGGSPVIDYRVIVTCAGDRTLEGVIGTETLVDKLTPGKSCTVILSARNIVGYGESDSRPFTTKLRGKPGIPTLKNTETAVFSEKITLTWSAASENGGKILTYTVWWREVASSGGVGEWIKQNTSSDDRTYTVTGLEFGKTYDIGITAWNKYGKSCLDVNNLKRIKVRPSKPAIPILQNEETKISSDKFILRWSSTSAEVRGGRILTYTVWRREVADNGTFGDWVKQNTSNNAVTYTVSGLEWCKTYQFGVTAWNKYGESKLHLNNLKKIKVVPSKQEQPSDAKDAIYGSITAILVLLNLFQLFYNIWMRRKMAVLDGEKRVSNTTSGDKDLYENAAAGGDTRTINTSSSSTDYMPLVPMTRSWEVSRDKVNIVKVIGKGAFGQVAKATVENLGNVNGIATVAVKMLKGNARNTDRKDLLSELELMKRLKPHPHVIKLLGCVTETEPIMVIIEYVPYGDLLGYLRKSRGLNDTYYKDPDVKPRTNLTSQQLIKFAWQVADGMKYLSNKKIIHRDLAARNVLVGEDKTCKVTDFGMARDVQQEDIYTKTSKGRLPVKWTSYEALMFGRYTTQSDIWSYGVLLYEVFTIGGSPYPRMKGQEIAQMLQDGYRMTKPQHVDQRLYQLMLDCWQENPDARPTFSSLRDTLKGMERNHVTYVNLKDYNSKLYANLEDLHGGQ